ncbi:MAG: hypothetical protein GSR77_06475, partial [Desulfurococcales archaeon]|nr:hypothetical protein [Desulfurococcales archaeon]
MKKPMYTAIHAIYHRPSSGCEFFEYEEAEGYYLAKCKVLGRYLTKDAAIKCENYWRTCPYRKIGLQMMEVEETTS